MSGDDERRPPRAFAIPRWAAPRASVFALQCDELLRELHAALYGSRVGAESDDDVRAATLIAALAECHVRRVIALQARTNVRDELQRAADDDVSELLRAAIKLRREDR